MMDESVKNPFSAPNAAVDWNLSDSVWKVGRFWGWVFAVPVFAFAALSCVGATRDWFGHGWTVAFKTDLLLTTLSVCLALTIFKCGSRWVRHFRSGSRMPLIAVAVIIGAGIAIFIYGVLVVFVVHRDRIHFSDLMAADDVSRALEVWIGMSLYMLIQGLLVRWSLKRRTRREELP